MSIDQNTHSSFSEVMNGETYMIEMKFLKLNKLQISKLLVWLRKLNKYTVTMWQFTDTKVERAGL